MDSNAESQQTEDRLLGGFGGLVELAGRRRALWPDAGDATVADWPDLPALRAPSPLLVMYGERDQLFTLAGMRRADARVREGYGAAGRPEAYAGRFFTGGHAFDRPMQRAAFRWLARNLK